MNTEYESRAESVVNSGEVDENTHEAFTLEKSTKPGHKASTPGIILFLLIAILGFVLFAVDFGKGPILSLNESYLHEESGTQATTGASINIQPKDSVKEDVLYRTSCPEEQLRLETDITTLNGQTVSCWPNTVTNSSTVYGVNTVKPVQSVVCPEGKTKIQNGSSQPPLVKVSCA